MHAQLRTRPRRPGPARVRGVCVAAAVVVGSLSGCADEPVTLSSPQVSAEDLATCNAFLDDLPGSLAGHERRKVNPAAALGRAWGDPAIIVRCGVPVPGVADLVAGCQEADGVGWFVPQAQLDDQDADVVFTAAGYRPAVSVEVPGKYRPEGGAAAIAELARPVKDHLELVQDCD